MSSFSIEMQTEKAKTLSLEEYKCMLFTLQRFGVYYKRVHHYSQ